MNKQDILNKKESTSIIDFSKYFFAILIVMIHSNIYFENIPLLSYNLAHVIARIGVPLFFVVSSYFVARKIKENPQYLKKYTVRLLKTYLLWSVLFIPVGLEWVQNNMDIPIYLYPVALIVALAYVGVYYHLWYIPALLIALWLTNWIIQKIGYKKTFIIAGLLFAFGALETYYGLINITFIKEIFDAYLSVFITTRNGLFFAFVFAVIGFYSNYKTADWNGKKPKWLLYSILSLILLIVEGNLVYKTGALNCNFLITLPFFILPFTQLLLNTKSVVSINIPNIHQLTNLIFFIHPLIIYLVAQNSFIKITEQGYHIGGLITFISATIITHGLALLIIWFKQSHVIEVVKASIVKKELYKSIEGILG